MAWFYVLVAVGVVVYFVQRGGLPAVRWPGEARAKPVAIPDPVSSVSDEELQRDRRQLLAAFRTDEMPASVDSEREDRRILEQSLQLLMDQCGAHEVVLWRPDDDAPGQFMAAAWARGPRPPTLSESERLLIELSATEQQATFNAAGARIAIVIIGVMLGSNRAAVSMHFREEPTMTRTELITWVQRHGRAIADLHDLLGARAVVAHRNLKLRKMILTATTLQGSRDPLALEQTLGHHACLVTGAQWAIIVRWDPVARVGVPTHIGTRAPDFGARLTAKQGSLVGEVCRTGSAKGFPDARPLLAGQEPVFDGAPLPEGTRSLLIVPLRRSDREAPIGALVLGHPERGALSQYDGHAGNDLGTIAAGALETAWAVQEATERARTDQLTGMPNRRAFDEVSARLLGETDRYGGAMAYVMVDIDHFKKVNDTYGHESGDAVLIAVGQALMDERRTTDFVARLGGEELALLLPQTEMEGAAELAERLRAKIEALRVQTPAGEVRVTASFGIALYQARSGTAGRVYERADKALYAAKHGGRNRVELERITPVGTSQVDDAGSR